MLKEILEEIQNEGLLSMVKCKKLKKALEKEQDFLRKMLNPSNLGLTDKEVDAQREKISAIEAEMKDNKCK